MKSLLFLTFILYCCCCCCLINAQRAPGVGFNANSCSFTTDALGNGYIGDYSELSFTSNNGTYKLPTKGQRWSIHMAPSITAYLPLNYEPPVIVTFYGVKYDVTVANMSCMMGLPLLKAPTSGQFLDVSIILNGTVDGELVDIYVDDQKNGTFTVKLVNGAITPFSVYFPYTYKTHTVKVVRLSNGQTVSTNVKYELSPSVTSYNCERFYTRNAPLYNEPEPELYVKCNLIGERLFESPYYDVALTSLNLTFKGDLPLNTSFTLGVQESINYVRPIPTGAYFQPHPQPFLSTFEYHKNANNYIYVYIEGIYIDAVNLKTITIKSGEKTDTLDCSYSYTTTEANGYVGTISCLIPHLSNYDDATITLIPTFYPNEPIKLLHSGSGSGSDSGSGSNTDSSISSASSISSSTSLLLFSLIILLTSIIF